MANTSNRALELLGLLQSHRFWSGLELADRLGVSERTLRRDVERLRELGYLIESVTGSSGGYQLASGSSLPPLLFTDEEAVALAVSLRRLADSPDSGAAEASLRALGKLTTLLPEAVKRRVEQLAEVSESAASVGQPPQPQAVVLGAIAKACHDSVRLKFQYIAPRRHSSRHGDRHAYRYADHTTSSDAAVTERYVEPYRLITLQQRWYLVAFDMDRSDWRTFRVDRMSDPEAARNSFTPRALPAQDLTGWLASRVRDLVPRSTVSFDVDITLEQARSRMGKWASLAEGSVYATKVTMTVDDLDWAVFTLCSLNRAFFSHSAELAAHVQQRAMLLLAAGE
jgi:predicted DNA-binding transcriptional regulator YafY